MRRHFSQASRLKFIFQSRTMPPAECLSEFPNWSETSDGWQTSTSQRTRTPTINQTRSLTWGRRSKWYVIDVGENCHVFPSSFLFFFYTCCAALTVRPSMIAVDRPESRRLRSQLYDFYRMKLSNVIVGKVQIIIKIVESSRKSTEQWSRCVNFFHLLNRKPPTLFNTFQQI